MISTDALQLGLLSPPLFVNDRLQRVVVKDREQRVRINDRKRRIVVNETTNFLKTVAFENDRF